jgi:AcrR family transcriptional regulator
MASVVARDGLAGATIASVAAEAGMQRTLLLHYFGTRAELIDAFINGAVADYGDRMLSGLTTDQPVQAQVDALFQPGFYRDADDLAVWAELVAVAGRDRAVRDRLRTLWSQRWLPALEHQLQQAYPDATDTQIAAAGYGLACLTEAHWAFQLQGVDELRHRDSARAAARAILDTIPSSPERQRCSTRNPG